MVFIIKFRPDVTINLLDFNILNHYNKKDNSIVAHRGVSAVVLVQSPHPMYLTNYYYIGVVEK